MNKGSKEIFKEFGFNTIFVSSHMYPENPKGTQVIVGSMNMGYIMRNLTTYPDEISLHFTRAVCISQEFVKFHSIHRVQIAAKLLGKV